MNDRKKIYQSNVCMKKRDCNSYRICYLIKRFRIKVINITSINYWYSRYRRLCKKSMVGSLNSIRV